MLVKVGMMNGLDYRDQVLEEEYHDAVMQSLFEGE